MRRISTILALTSIFALPMAVGCGDDDDDRGDAPATGGKGGSTSGKGGSSKGGSTSAKGGDGAGGDTTGTGGDAMGGDTGMAGDTNMGGGGSGPVGCDIDNLPDGGNLPASGTVASGMTYLINGRTDVVSGETLTIEPCVKVLGSGTDDVIVVQPGGTLNAVGTADEPIVFTSAEAAPAPGDWGGIVLAGNGVCNDATDVTKCIVEGFATDAPEYGNTDATATNDESSGSLEYVRIEYPGVDLGGGKEINGLTLAGIGSGTTISHVMVAHALDDCFEFFGGAVDADHLICYDPGDDMFDTDQGYSGSVQFVFGRQLEPVSSDPNGFEMDNDTDVLDKAPISAPNFANVTLCGTNAVAAGAAKVGAMLRRGTGGSLINVIITGFETAGMSVRNTPSTTITLTNSTVFGNTAEFDATHDGGATWFTDQTGNSTADPGNLGNCFADPPAPFPDAAIAGGTPTGHADETAEYQGAFENAAGNWMTGLWVSWD